MNKEYDVAVRVEIGDSVGFGHFYRCLALAEELQKKNRKVIFVSGSKNLKKFITGKFGLYLLKGKTESQRISECKKIGSKIKFWVFDLPKENEMYSKKFKNENSALIDDLGNIRVNSKFVFNGGMVKKFQKYNSKDTRLFIGTKYMILRKNFYKNKIKSASRKKIKKILLTFGGNDDKNLTSKILSSIENEKYDITALLGPTYKYTKKIKQNFKSNKKIKFVSDVKDTSTLFKKFDLVIATPGITLYELACIGVPTIMISINDDQKQLAKAFQRKKFGKDFGFWRGEKWRLIKEILKMDDSKIRKEMKRKGQKLVDGKGVLRVTNTIEKFLKLV